MLSISTIRDTVFRLSWGRMAQTQRPDELQVQDGDARFHSAQRSTQTVLSVERKIQPMALLRIEAFDKRIANPMPIYENLLDPFALFPELEADRVRVAPDSSHVHGAELSLRWQSAGTWSGWMSYSWSQATDRTGARPRAAHLGPEAHDRERARLATRCVAVLRQRELAQRLAAERSRADRSAERRREWHRAPAAQQRGMGQLLLARSARRMGPRAAQGRAPGLR